MPVNESFAAASEDDVNGAGAPGRGQPCSCLPFCFWGGRRAAASGGGSGAAAPQGRRRRRGFRLRLPWFSSSWPWLRKRARKEDNEEEAGGKTKRGRRGRRLLLLLTTSLQAKKALASVVSGDGSSLLPAKVSSFGDAKKQSRSKQPRPTADSGAKQPQAFATTVSANAPAPSRPVTDQPCRRPTDEPAAAGRIWRAPSRRHSLHQPDRGERRPDGSGGLWTAATTLGVIVLFGRVTAVVFLCSCLYGVRFVRARAGGRRRRQCKGQERWRRWCFDQ